MKRIKYYLATLATGVLMFSSCSDKFFDINTDPNNPSDVVPSLVLPSGLSSSAFVIGGYYHALGSFWSQQYAQAPGASQWTEWESYNLSDDVLDRQFTLLYAGGLNDYEYVRTKTAKTGNWAYYSIATLMQAYTFQVLADLYDQIPFSEALQGSKSLQPHYNSGAVVYDSLLVRINNAESKDFASTSSEKPGASDLIFGGEMGDWIKFANTLKLKMYLRYVNVDANKYKNQIVALLAENNFLDKDAKFSAFKAEETGYNPFFNTFVDRLGGNIVANNTIMNFLSENNDPRKEKLFEPAVTDASYKGVVTGTAKVLSGLSINDYSIPKFGNIDPVYFFTKEETLFLIAEAQARYGSATDAEATFNKAVEASLTSLGLAKDAVTYPYNGIKSIIEQKWVAATNKRAIESYFDFNRTGYPDFLSTSPISVLTGDAKPKRLFFPASERQSNSNTPAKVALTVKVWWGK